MVKLKVQRYDDGYDASISFISSNVMSSEMNLI